MDLLDFLICQRCENVLYQLGMVPRCALNIGLERGSIFHFFDGSNLIHSETNFEDGSGVVLQRFPYVLCVLSSMFLAGRGG